MSKYTDKSVLSQVEHFQNQFIIQKLHLEELHHLIKINEGFLTTEIKSNPVAVDHRTVKYHNNEKIKTDQIRK